MSRNFYKRDILWRHLLLAKEAVEELLTSAQPQLVSKEIEAELRRIMTADAKAHGLEKLPG